MNHGYEHLYFHRYPPIPPTKPLSHMKLYVLPPYAHSRHNFHLSESETTHHSRCCIDRLILLRQMCHKIDRWTWCSRSSRTCTQRGWETTRQSWCTALTWSMNWRTQRNRDQWKRRSRSFHRHICRNSPRSRRQLNTQEWDFRNIGWRHHSNTGRFGFRCILWSRTCRWTDSVGCRKCKCRRDRQSRGT